MFRGVLGKTLGLVGLTVQYGCIAHCAFEYIGELVVCSGPSMEPTIVGKDVVFSEHVSRHLFKIEKGDIVIAKCASDPHMNICKRVIGLEGDKVCTSSPSDIFKTHTFVSISSLKTRPTSAPPHGFIYMSCTTKHGNPHCSCLNIPTFNNHFPLNGKKV
ncbi:mitochondrial inner membrane protease subunit 1 [Gadus chalcogrammus]|uniref:mitochondrial inner membrane protease subunit 1 n=1 Tax=Gadus chalcogrammus TaxID=1042646 RepID=UPI0024C4A6C1|nr:mitochondrial inner membrane protease subunit 1 [Gadus chalcogrammus]